MRKLRKRRIVKEIKLLLRKIWDYLSWLNICFEERYKESANEKKTNKRNTRKMYYKI